MYEFREQLDLTGFAAFDKQLITDGRWAGWTFSAKAVYPVLLAHVNDRGEAWPAEQTIAILAGRTDKVVRDGICHLAEAGVLSVGHYVTSRGVRAKRYRVHTPPHDRGRWFPFRACVLHAGNWRRLTPTAQALYPVMRCFGFADTGTVMADEESTEFMEAYTRRDHDLCAADWPVLAERAGIDRRSLAAAMTSLRGNFLVDSSDEVAANGNGCTKVFLTPPQRWDPAWLNGQVREAYASELAKREPPRWKKLPVDTGNTLPIPAESPGVATGGAGQKLPGIQV